MHTANKQKKNLDFGLKPSKRLDNTTITATNSFYSHKKEILHYNESNSFVNSYVNDNVKPWQTYLSI